MLEGTRPSSNLAARPTPRQPSSSMYTGEDTASTAICVISVCNRAHHHKANGEALTSSSYATSSAYRR